MFESTSASTPRVERLMHARMVMNIRLIRSVPPFFLVESTCQKNWLFVNKNWQNEGATWVSKEGNNWKRGKASAVVEAAEVFVDEKNGYPIFSIEM